MMDNKEIESLQKEVMDKLVYLEGRSINPPWFSTTSPPTGRRQLTVLSDIHKALKEYAELRDTLDLE